MKVPGTGAVVGGAGAERGVGVDVEVVEEPGEEPGWPGRHCLLVVCLSLT